MSLQLPVAATSLPSSRLRRCADGTERAKPVAKRRQGVEMGPKDPVGRADEAQGAAPAPSAPQSREVPGQAGLALCRATVRAGGSGAAPGAT